MGILIEVLYWGTVGSVVLVGLGLAVGIVIVFNNLERRNR